MRYLVENDGVDHINVDCAARTMLGILLHNGAYSPMALPDYGRFVSISGFWGWYVTGKRHEVFRMLHSDAPMDAISALSVVYDPSLGSAVTQAMRCKLDQNLTLKEMFDLNQLPLVRYERRVQRPYFSDMERWALDDNWTMKVLQDLKQGQ
jgi:hypothetical protein